MYSIYINIYLHKKLELILVDTGIIINSNNNMYRLFSMSRTNLIFIVFPILVAILVFGIWSNIYVYAQQSSSPLALASPASQSSSPPAPASSPSATTISSELKAKMCDPSNPSLKVVNTTESNICGIPKTIKNTIATTTVAAPSTPRPTVGVSSPSTPKATPARTTTAIIADSADANEQKQQQRPVDVVNNNPASASNGAGKTVDQVSSLGKKPVSAIAPQANAINQQQQPTTTNLVVLQNTSNGTALQNYTFASISTATPGKLMHLGYNGSTTSTTTTTTDRDSKDNDNSDSKSSNDHHSGDSSSSSNSQKDSADRNHSNSNSKDKSSNDAKSSDHNNNNNNNNDDGSKSDHKDHDSNGSSKGKNESGHGSKGHDNHKGGDSSGSSKSSSNGS